MTPIEAARTLEFLAKSYGDPHNIEAFRLAAQVLRNNPDTTIAAIQRATGRDVTVQSIRDPEGGVIVNAWVHRGASVSAKSLPEALEALLEKVTAK